jgi:hypothetical protein
LDKSIRTVGGILIAWLHPDRALLLDALSFVLSGALLAVVAWPNVQASVTPGGYGFIQDALVGLRYLWADRVLRRLLLVLSPLNVAFGPMVIFSAAFSNRVLHAGPTGYGVIEAAAGVGSIIGGMVAPVAAKRASFTAWLMTLLGSITVQLALSAAVRNLWVTAGCGILAWAASGIFNVPLTSAVQRMVPLDQVGRVLQALFLVSGGITVPIGLLAGSWLMERTGVVPVFYLQAAVVALLAVTVWVFPITRTDHPILHAFGSSDQ